MVDAIMNFMQSDVVMISLIFVTPVVFLTLGFVLIIRPLRADANRPENPHDASATEQHRG